MINKEPNKIALLGAGCSLVSERIAEVAKTWNLLMVSTVTLATPAMKCLDRKKNFPYALEHKRARSTAEALVEFTARTVLVNEVAVCASARLACSMLSVVEDGAKKGELIFSSLVFARRKTTESPESLEQATARWHPGFSPRSRNTS